MFECERKKKVLCKESESDEEIDPNADIPSAFFWQIDEVADWVERIGYPRYKDTFMANFISGRKLILVNESTLPSMGIKDFEDIKKITASIRKLLKLEKKVTFEPDFKKIRDPKEEFLLQKTRTGRKSDQLYFTEFRKKFSCLKFYPGLTNLGYCSIHN